MSQKDSVSLHKQSKPSKDCVVQESQDHTKFIAICARLNGDDAMSCYWLQLFTYFSTHGQWVTTFVLSVKNVR